MYSINFRIIQRIVESSINAPSGDNAQPWKFVIENNTLNIYNIPDRDVTLYNFKNRGDYVAHGALIENIFIVAKHFGYHAEFVFFPNSDNETYIGSIHFIPLTKQQRDIKENLYQYIAKRTTNRKPYDSNFLLSEKMKEKLTNVGQRLGKQMHIVLKQGNKDLFNLAEIASLNDYLLLKNKDIHDFLFSIIRWTKEEERKTAGMLIDTLELAKPQQIVFQLFRHWTIVRFAQLLGIPTAIRKQTASLYRSSSAIGAVIIPQDTPIDFLYAGSAFERMWLNALSMDLCIQPIAAIPYLYQRVQAKNIASLSKKQIQKIEIAGIDLHRIFQVKKGENIAMMFRIGKGASARAFAYKFPPNIIVK